MNSTSSDWNLSLHHSAILSSTSIHNILVVIGLITVGFLCLILIIQFLIKIHREKVKSRKKSTQYVNRYSSYPKLFRLNNRQCQCFHYSCLSKFPCIQSTCQISSHSSIYERINDKPWKCQHSFPPHLSCIDVHIVQ